MKRLSAEQSGLLKRLNESSLYYDDLTPAEIDIYRFLRDLGYVKSAAHLEEVNDYIYKRSIDSISITEKGKMYLINESLSADQMRFIQEQLDSLREIASAAQAQAVSAQEIADASNVRAATAIADSESARKDAHWSKVVSIVAIVISICAIVIPIAL